MVTVSSQHLGCDAGEPGVHSHPPLESHSEGQTKTLSQEAGQRHIPSDPVLERQRQEDLAVQD